MTKPTLLPDPTCLHLNLLDASEAVITAVVTTTAEEAACPLCHRCSAQIHSRYTRTVADLPWMGCAVRLELHIRRFFCPNPECRRQIFTERLPSVVVPYARRTTEFAPAHLAEQALPVDLASLAQGYGPAEVAMAWKWEKIGEQSTKEAMRFHSDKLACQWRTSKQVLRPGYAVAKPSEMAKPSGTPKSVIVTLFTVETRMLQASRS